MGESGRQGVSVSLPVMRSWKAGEMHAQELFEVETVGWNQVERGNGAVEEERDMIMIGLIERFCRKAYKGLTIFAKLLLMPSAIVILPAMVILAIVEFMILDIAWITMDFIDSKNDGNHFGLSRTVRWLMW